MVFDGKPGKHPYCCTLPFEGTRQVSDCFHASQGISNWRSFMKSKTLASAVRVLSLLLLVSGTCALAQESKARADWHEPQDLVGTWRLQVTPVYCPGVTTGTLAAPFQGLVSFTGDRNL